jgi:hypothetical protein
VKSERPCQTYDDALIDLEVIKYKKVGVELIDWANYMKPKAD